MNLESPVAAVTRVLEHQKVQPNNILIMMLIDAVRETTPVPEATHVGMLAKILQSLEPHSALDGWATRSSREIVKILSTRPEVKRAAELVGDERIWCQLEGVIAGMLMRVCQGKDLEP